MSFKIKPIRFMPMYWHFVRKIHDTVISMIIYCSVGHYFRCFLHNIMKFDISLPIYRHVLLPPLIGFNDIMMRQIFKFLLYDISLQRYTTFLRAASHAARYFAALPLSRPATTTTTISRTLLPALLRLPSNLNHNDFRQVMHVLHLVISPASFRHFHDTMQNNLMSNRFSFYSRMLHFAISPECLKYSLRLFSLGRMPRASKRST